MTTNDKRLIEVAFPLKQTSLDSVHEKNVRHGHISTLHIWPARRPLAAARAALIATLLPDPDDPDKRKEILERMAGRVVEKIERRRINGRLVEKVKEETVGGILHWGRENGPDLQWFRDEIRKAYGGRAPKVLDPFAGGGAIPLEAMRLGCEVTAMDINPVAGSSSNARSNTRRDWPDRRGRCRTSHCATASSWRASSRARDSRGPACVQCSNGSATGRASPSSNSSATKILSSRRTWLGRCALGGVGCWPGRASSWHPTTRPTPNWAL